MFRFFRHSRQMPYFNVSRLKVAHFNVLGQQVAYLNEKEERESRVRKKRSEEERERGLSLSLSLSLSLVLSISSHFLSNSPFPLIPDARMQQLKSPCCQLFLHFVVLWIVNIFVRSSLDCQNFSSQYQR